MTESTPNYSTMSLSDSEEEISVTTAESTPDYSTMTLKELKEVADNIGVSYSSRVSKASLIKKIEEEI